MDKMVATLFHLVAFIPCMYIAARYILLINLSKGYQILLLILILLGSQLHFLVQHLHEPLFSSKLSRPLVFLLTWWFCSIIFLTAMLLLFDLIFCIMQTFKPFKFEWVSYLRMGLGPLAMLLAGLGLSRGVSLPDLKIVTIHLPHLPKAFEGYRIVQMSDIHASNLLSKGWIQEIVQRANQLHPDLITITGDIADGAAADRSEDLQPLMNLNATDGVYAVTGNHEYYFDIAPWKAVYANLGIQFLENERVQIKKANASLWLAGVPDEEAIHYGFSGPDLAVTLHGIPAKDVVILLCHKPGKARLSAEAGVSLQLSGHTHGGMIRGLDFLVQLANQGFVSGLYQVKQMILYVNNGTGLWNGFPCRLGRPSEITLFILHADQS